MMQASDNVTQGRVSEAFRSVTVILCVSRSGCVGAYVVSLAAAEWTVRRDVRRPTMSHSVIVSLALAAAPTRCCFCFCFCLVLQK
jgi:hypothetical protein